MGHRIHVFLYTHSTRYSRYGTVQYYNIITTSLMCVRSLLIFRDRDISQNEDCSHFGDAVAEVHHP
jgi:hypothetical protein